jgi:hypothetical protein
MAGSRPSRSASLPISVVHVFVSGQSPEHGLAKLSDQGVAAVLARPGIRKDFSGQVCQAKRIIEISEREQPSVGGHARTVEFQPQAGIERDPESGSVFFTRCTVHLQPH